MNVFELDQTYIASTYARFPVQIAAGKGSLLTDEKGKSYIDLGSGIAVNTFGTADEVWMQAVSAQMGRFQHSSNLFYTEPCARLAEMLCRRTGMKKVFFSNSGAEANETAIKAAREYAALHKGKDCHTIVTLSNSFHGRTLATLAATGQEKYHSHFGPMPQGFVSIEANPEALGAVLERLDVAGILFEVVQGEGGVLPLSPAFLSALEQAARDYDVLLMADEVQCGNGRSGKLFSYMHRSLKPDVVTTAKGLGGGLPIGATLLGEKAQNVFTPGMNGSTFGGNPICCAGAISILERLDEDLMAQVQEKSAYVFSQLTGAPGIEGVTGLGLMIGVKPTGDTQAILAQCREQGVLLLTAKDKLRLLPPLNIPWELLEKAVGILKQACAENAD